MIVVADTSGRYAAFNIIQAEYPQANRVLNEERLAISPLVLPELDHLAQQESGFEKSASRHRLAAEAACQKAV